MTPGRDRTGRFVIVGRVLYRLRRESVHGSGAGSAVALPCRVVRGVEGVGLCLLGTFDREAWGLDILCHEERG